MSAKLEIVMVDGGTTGGGSSGGAGAPVSPGGSAANIGPQVPASGGITPSAGPRASGAGGRPGLDLATSVLSSAGFGRISGAMTGIVGQYDKLAMTLTKAANAGGVAGNVAGALGVKATTAGAGAMGPHLAGTAANAAAQAGAGASGAVGAAAAALSPAAVAIVGIGTVAVAAGAAVVTFTKVMLNEAKKIEGYSGAVSAATSMAEIREELALMRRAEKIGPQVAGFQNQYSKFETAMSDIWTEILKLLLNAYEFFKPVVEFVTDMANLIAAGIDLTGDQIAVIIALLTPWRGELTGAVNELGKSQERVAKALKNLFDDKEDKIEEDAMTRAFFDNWAAAGSQAARAASGVGFATP